MQLEYPDVSAIRVRPADIVFEDKLTLDLGGVTAQLMRWPNSHAEDCTVVYVPEDGVLYLGDICYHDLHHEPDCWHRRRFEQLLACLEACDFRFGVFGHHDPLPREALLADVRQSLTENDVLILDD